ncbi:MAG: thiamine pyrophosphate-dependent dehydrogenase E1 component subunit alpha [Anaerolineaceae bacterium]|nr:thiamine pyrophosphate-dependent dehydrogenase E1 component subunit alpha [Anaerolineaceae bacterium]
MELSTETKKELFWMMLLARRLDERAWALYREKKVTFHISGIGHEAAQVGAGFALRQGYDWVTPYYRDLSLLLVLDFSARDFMLNLMGKQEALDSGGRQMPGNWSFRRSNILSHSTPVATQVLHAVGIGQAIKLKNEDKVVLASMGEGATSQGEWYEAVNWAAVHKLPVIFFVQNNRLAISTRQEQQMAVENVSEKAAGLGLPGVTVDGTDAVAVYRTVLGAVENARTGMGPSLVEAQVYRITPHSSDDDDRSYRSREEVEVARHLDPLNKIRKELLYAGILTEEQVDEMETEAELRVADAVLYAERAPNPSADEGLHPVYAEEVSHA